MATQSQHESKTKLLNAALNVIRAKGYAAATIDDICHAAGVTKGSFFHHFKSKDELALSAVAFWGEMTEGFFASAPYHQSKTPWSVYSVTSISAPKYCKATCRTTRACSALWCRRPTPRIPTFARLAKKACPRILRFWCVTSRPRNNATLPTRHGPPPASVTSSNPFCRALSSSPRQSRPRGRAREPLSFQTLSAPVVQSTTICLRLSGGRHDDRQTTSIPGDTVALQPGLRNNIFRERRLEAWHLLARGRRLRRHNDSWLGQVKGSFVRPDMGKCRALFRVAKDCPITNLITVAAERGLVESPRWHAGRLWFADWTAGEILAAGRRRRDLRSRPKPQRRRSRSTSTPRAGC